MADARSTARAKKKLDRTDVTDIDTFINIEFIKAVKARSGERASVMGEEESDQVEGSSELWIIDPIDGTGEYIDDTLDDSERTSCVGVALFREGRLQLSVVHNPFRNELFVADHELGAFLNGEPLDLRQTEASQLTFGPDIPYDYAHWEDAPTDARFFEEIIGRPPINNYSAIYQACDVARGRSAFAVFPGNTIHDIAPSALIVELAGGEVSGVHGPLDWQDLNGVVYAVNRQIHTRVVQELYARR